MKKSILKYLIISLTYFICVSKAQSVDQLRPASEPYAIPGKVIVFTNWYYVRPGNFDWVNSNGKSVYANDKAKMGKYEANFVPEDSPLGIELFSEPAQSEIPEIKADKPWDKWGIRLATLIHENGVYRLWGSCNASSKEEFNCYFESKDGQHWEKPDLDIVEFNGNKHNNLFKDNVGLSVFIDPSAPVVERYKTVWHTKISHEEFLKYKNSRAWSVMATELDAPDVHVMKGAFSPDGLHWTVLKDPISFEHCDSQNIVYYDNRSKEYILYMRGFMLGPRAPGQPYPKESFHQYVWRRAIAMTESKDFKKFPLSHIILEPGPEMRPSDQFYTNCMTNIPGAPYLKLMFPAVYNVADDITEIDLYSSYNGKNWHKVPGDPVYQTQEFGKPDGGCVFASPNLVERPNGDWILPYVGYNVPHKYPRGSYKFEPGMLVWPKGRLAGIMSKGKGEFATVAFVAPGNILKINALTKRAGYIKVEVVGMDGKPIKGHTFADAEPVIGNQYKSIVRWKNSNNLGIKTGTPVFLRFKMKMAKIYELYFDKTR